jgi:hypothetical protein
MCVASLEPVDRVGLSAGFIARPTAAKTAWSASSPLAFSIRVHSRVTAPTDTSIVRWVKRNRSHLQLPDSHGVRTPNGPTKLKRRLLAAAGWRVISVPFFDWDRLETAGERQAYIERAVGPLGVALPRASPEGCTSHPSCSSPLPARSSSPNASRGQGPEYEADSCGSPSGSPSPKEAESGSSLAAGAYLQNW